MAMKDWFGAGSKGAGDSAVDVDSLVAQGEWDEAEAVLRQRLKRNQGDLYSRLKLADVLMKLKKQREAVDEYLIAAESYARDGFFDKATALLRKIQRMAPSNESIELKLEALGRAKDLERRRDLVLNSLMESGGEGEGKYRTSAIEWQQIWSALSQSSVIESLSDDQVCRLFGATDVVRFDEDQELVKSGDKHEAIYFVGRGLIEARIPLKGGIETAIRSFDKGDLIGDRALLEHQAWPARYVASKRTTALKLDRNALAKTLTGEADPKGFLDALRSQKHDHQTVLAIRELEDDD